MRALSRLRLYTLVLAGFLLWSGVGLAEDVLRLRAIDPKPFYKPGDTIVLEMRCRAGVSDAVVLYNPTLQGIDSGFMLPDLPKCPVSRFEVAIPRDFVGRNQVTVLTQYRDQPHAAIYEFEVRSDEQPSREPKVRALEVVSSRASATSPAGPSSGPPRISIPAFRNDPKKLDRNPMDVGKCRLLQHHQTGYCYIYSLPESRKVSQDTDARCTELDQLRRRMLVAIEEGYCGLPAARSSARATASVAGGPELDKTMAEIRKLGTLVEAYTLDHNVDGYPVVPDVPALAALVEPVYMEPGGTPFVDGWGTPFRYVCDGKDYRIVSAGEDRAFESDSARLDTTPAGETNSLASDLVYSNGRFVQWPKQEGR